MKPDVDQIVKAVAEMLAKRANQERTVSIEAACPDESLFLSYSTIIIENVDLLFLKTLLTLDPEQNSWVNWFQKGFNYDIHFEMRIGFQDINLIPWSLLTKWPIQFTSKDQRSIVVINHAHISYADVMLMKKASVLAKLKTQKLTDLAQESLAKSQIPIIERIDSQCIWE